MVAKSDACWAVCAKRGVREFNRFWRCTMIPWRRRDEREGCMNMYRREALHVATPASRERARALNVVDLLSALRPDKVELHKIAQPYCPYYRLSPRIIPSALRKPLPFTACPLRRGPQVCQPDVVSGDFPAMGTPYGLHPFKTVLAENHRSCVSKPQAATVIRRTSSRSWIALAHLCYALTTRLICSWILVN